jgi:chemotaxis signal transduction protein
MADCYSRIAGTYFYTQGNCMAIIRKKQKDVDTKRPSVVVTTFGGRTTVFHTGGVDIETVDWDDIECSEKIDDRKLKRMARRRLSEPDCSEFICKVDEIVAYLDWLRVSRATAGTAGLKVEP